VAVDRGARNFIEADIPEVTPGELAAVLESPFVKV
jgi:hypothetical protein